MGHESIQTQGQETGGGGDAGPDGRMLVGTGLLIILAAGFRR
ncbi:hypothetical protein [Acrocarpospora corrugata]|nr:hypothetical protein [Acrocarpospora corrugata]